MKTVLLKYPGGKGKQMKKFKVAPATKGSSFRSFITRELNQFYETDYFLLNLSNGFEILDESLPFSEITSEKRLPLQLVYCHTTVTYINCNDQKKSVSLDLKVSCEKNIQQIINSPEFKYYSFAFRPADDNTFMKITCKSLPLVFQGWYGEQLYLTRYVLPSESKNLDLYNHCVFSSKLSLSIMLPNDWVNAAIYRLIAEGKSPKDITRQHLIEMIPPQIRMDDALFAHGQKVLFEFQRLSRDEAKSHYIEMCIFFAGQCCYIDRVQMAIVGKWKLMTTRYIYVSPLMIFVSKDFGANIVQKVPFTDIQFFNSEDDFVVLSFHNGQKWRIKSKNKAILLNILSDAKGLIPSYATPLTHQLAKTALVASSDSIKLSDEQESVTDEDIQIYSVSSASRPEIEHHESIICNGLSPIIVPSVQDGEKPFDEKPLMFRDLKCIQKVEIPEENTETVVEPVPDLSQYTGELKKVIKLIHELNTKQIIIITFVLFIIFVFRVGLK